MSIYKLVREDKSVAIMYLKEGVDIAEEINKQAELDIKYEKVVKIAPSEIPTNRKYRDAWADISPLAEVDIDLDKVKELKLKELREKRKDKLADLDTKMLIALEEGADLKEIKAKKKKLRDLTDPLKALDVKGKINDESIIKKIEELADVLD